MNGHARARHRPRSRAHPVPGASTSSPANLNPENTMSSKTQNAEDTQDLKALLREAEKALSNTAGQAGEKFDDLRERLRDALEQGRYSFEHIREEATRRAKQADNVIRENPYYAIGIAAGVGALIGALVSRSCSQSR